MMFAAILSKCKSNVYKCTHPQDETKKISLKYNRKREVLFAAVDANSWSATTEISCDDVGALIQDSPLHFPYDMPERSMEWIADNLIRIEYIENKDDEKFRIFFGDDRDNVMKSLETSLLDYVNDDVPFDFLLEVMEEVHSDWNGKISDTDNFFTKTEMRWLNERSKCEAPDVKSSSEDPDTPPSVTQPSKEFEVSPSVPEISPDVSKNSIKAENTSMVVEGDTEPIEISREHDHLLIIPESEDVAQILTKQTDKLAKEMESGVSSGQDSSDDDDQQLIIQEIENSLQKNTPELDDTNNFELASYEIPSTSPNDTSIEVSTDTPLISPENKALSSLTDKYKQAMKETFRLYEAMQLDKANRNLRRAATWDKFWQKFCRSDLTDDKAITLNEYVDLQYKVAAKKHGLPQTQMHYVNLGNSATNQKSVQDDSKGSPKKKKNKNKKRTVKKKRLSQNSSMSILRGMLRRKGSKVPKTLPRLRTDAIQKFGVLETVTPSFKKVPKHILSPKTKMKKQKKESRIGEKSALKKRRKRAKKRRRKLVDKEFKSTIDLTRKWDQRLDTLLAKYHMQTCSDTTYIGRTTF